MRTGTTLSHSYDIHDEIKDPRAKYIAYWLYRGTFAAKTLSTSDPTVRHSSLTQPVSYWYGERNCTKVGPSIAKLKTGQPELSFRPRQLAKATFCKT